MFTTSEHLALYWRDIQTDHMFMDVIRAVFQYVYLMSDDLEKLTAAQTDL